MNSHNKLVSIIPLAVLTVTAHGATTITPLTSFDPTTFFANVTAGFDFNGAGGPNQSGFTSIAPGSGGTYSATNNGITMDLAVTGFNASAHRNRNNAAAGNLVMDFGQWYHTTNANAEAAFTFTGLKANTVYEITMFVYNAGSGQMKHNFYEGTSSAGTFLTQYTTAGNQNNYSTWSPGITFGIDSGASSTISVTMQEAGSRLNIDGISIVEVPEPSLTALLGLGGVCLLRRRRR
ncbi:PEP-CTERM sorting domain-containing protein [Akkermansiaceae bacterium]|nr:PEP-CTERM sorting domain-containing protein [Akkermansiaceae bacterium]